MCKVNGDEIYIPERGLYISPGCKVKLNRFGFETWTVQYGWFSFGGNRPICGWYLVSESTEEIRPLQKPDLTDIYMIFE